MTITGPATQRIFGFQLSAVADATNQQAGTLTARKRPSADHVRPGNCGNVDPAWSVARLQARFNTRSIATRKSLTNPYLVNWTAPSSASVGTIRFNVAGNAANGDITNQGDYIYTNVYRIGALNLSVAPSRWWIMVAFPSSPTAAAI